MSTSELSALSILLVEPSPTQCKIITSHLSEEGVEHIDSVSDGEEAIAFIQKYPPDLVISAMYLPDMSATELLTELRHRKDSEALNFMLISSETAFTMLDPIRQAGVVAILPKPFAHRDLLRALRTTLDYISPEELALASYEVDELKVLVVDDSMTARNHIARVLGNMGIMNITKAENGLDAIAKLADDAFDLIITDLNMPEMDGQQLIEHVRHEIGNTYIPIMMITSEHDAARLSSVQQSGVSAICDKPFEPQAVREILFQVLDEA